MSLKYLRGLWVKKKLLAELNKEVKKETCVPVNKTLDKSVEEIEKDAFENEPEISKIMLLEKENEAIIRGRLLKECGTLLAEKKISYTSMGIDWHNIEQDLKSTEASWQNYTLGGQITLKKPLAPVLASICKVPPSGGSGPPNKESKDSEKRIKRMEPGKVMMAFIPEEWWRFFLPKTGVSGFWTFLFTTGIWLVSKEYYVLEHNYYGGLSMFVIWYYAIKYVGPMLSNWLDKDIDAYEKAWIKFKEDQQKDLKHAIGEEVFVQTQADGQLMLFDAKRENVALQLEDEFRKRQMHVYEEVKKKLDYHVAIAQAHKRVIHKNLVDYVTREVRKSITPDMEKQLINVSIQTIISEFEKPKNKD
ncbi:hypothetical protein NQ317_002882 [Molorchus minor]|uniref:ATP synthase subunit b n=1 Tax=Molorchus minor TaxID=1323400 RepID=A0ABQ9JTA7_9CUCU|nr:hypothetical protein NQ317_002882 [Molorchus minor]